MSDTASGESSASGSKSASQTSGKKESAFTIDIKEICLNVKYRLQFESMEREGSIEDIKNLQETPYLTDAWFDHNKLLEKYAYYGEKKGTRSRVREFLTHLFAIKSIEQRAMEKADVAKVLSAFPERPIKCYNMRAVVYYLGAAKGVTVSPRDLVRFLRVRKIKKAGKNYADVRESEYLRKLNKAIADLNESMKDYDSYVQKRIKFLDGHPKVTKSRVPETIASMRVENAHRKVFAKMLAARINKVMWKKYDDFGHAFWNFRYLSEEADSFLFEFLMKYIPNLCKLNPAQEGEKPKAFN